MVDEAGVESCQRSVFPGIQVCRERQGRKECGPDLHAGLRPRRHPAPLKPTLHTCSQVPLGSPLHTQPLQGIVRVVNATNILNPTPHLFIILPPHLFTITPPHLFVGAVRVLDARGVPFTPPHLFVGAVRVIDARGVPVGPFGCNASIVELAWPDSDMSVDLPNAEQHRWVLVCRASIKHVPILSNVYAARLASRCA